MGIEASVSQEQKWVLGHQLVRSKDEPLDVNQSKVEVLVRSLDRLETT